MRRWLVGHMAVTGWEKVVHFGYISKEGLTGRVEGRRGAQEGGWNPEVALG